MTLRLLLCILIASFTASCKSKPKSEPQPEVTYMADREAPPQQVPDDWPITKEQYELIGWDTASKLLDPQAIEAAGFHSRKEIVEFAYRLLKMDYTPIARVMGERFEGEDRGAAYEILGHYGSLEDAKKHFDAVKAIDAGDYEKSSAQHQILTDYMVRSLGYYLMRDHFLPQEDRDLMIEIEEFFYRCTEAGAHTCWLYNGQTTKVAYMQPSARYAIAKGCSERVKARAKAYASDPKGSWTEHCGHDILTIVKQTETNADRIRKQLPPVLPEKEIDQ